MKPHRYALCLLLITSYHGTSPKEINLHGNHELDYSSQSKNQNSTLKPFSEMTGLHQPEMNKNGDIHQSKVSGNEHTQYIGLSLIRKENSNKSLSENNADEFAESLNFKTTPKIIKLMKKFKVEERDCFNKGEFYYNGKCENLFDQDPCGIGKLLVLDMMSASLPEPKIVPKCIENNCSESKIYWPATKQCYAINDKNNNKLCLPGNKFERDYFSGNGICKCKEYPTVYGQFINGTCFELFTQGPCTNGYIFVEENRVTKCIKNPCKNSSHVLWEDGDRKCYELNSIGQCAEGKIFKISVETLKPTCSLHLVPFTTVDVPKWCDNHIPGDCDGSFKIKPYNNIKDIIEMAKKKLVQAVLSEVELRQMGKMCDEELISEARETFQAIMEISNLLNTGLDAETLTYCVRLCESGVHPVALATIVKGIKKEVELLRQKRENSFEKSNQD